MINPPNMLHEQFLPSPDAPGIDLGILDLICGTLKKVDNLKFVQKKPPEPEQPNIGADILLACMQGYLHGKKKKKTGGI